MTAITQTIESNGLAPIFLAADAPSTVEMVCRRAVYSADQARADKLFDAAVAGARIGAGDGGTVALVGAFEAQDGSSWTLTTGIDADGGRWDLWTVRDAEGEFVGVAESTRIVSRDQLA